MLDAFLQSLGRSAWVGAAIAHRNWLKAGLTEPTKGVLAVLSVGGWCLLAWRSCQGASPLLTLSVGYIVGYVLAIISIIH